MQQFSGLTHSRRSAVRTHFPLWQDYANHSLLAMFDVGFPEWNRETSNAFGRECSAALVPIRQQAIGARLLCHTAHNHLTSVSQSGAVLARCGRQFCIQRQQCYRYCASQSRIRLLCIRFAAATMHTVHLHTRMTYKSQPNHVDRMNFR